MAREASAGLTINGRFLSQPVTGVQRYAREIVCQLDQILYSEKKSVRLKAKIVGVPGTDTDFSRQAITLQHTPVGGGPVWDQIVLPFYNDGILLSLCNQGPIASAKQIICIHDLNTVLAPQSYSKSFRLLYNFTQPLLARRAAKLVTVSQFSARMLVEHRFCAADHIVVIPNGHEHVYRWDATKADATFRRPQRRPYIFVLGSRARHKNVDVLLRAGPALDRMGIDVLVAGGTGSSFSQANAQTSSPNVRYLGFVSDNDLAALYKNALCFAFPSITEGFGLPALEALASGCPVIASEIPALKEVCGDSALYANPNSADDWIFCVELLAAHPERAANLREKGLARAKAFSWRASAEAYFGLVNEIGLS